MFGIGLRQGGVALFRVFDLRRISECGGAGFSASASGFLSKTGAGLFQNRVGISASSVTMHAGGTVFSVTRPAGVSMALSSPTSIAVAIMTRLMSARSSIWYFPGLEPIHKAGRAFGNCPIFALRGHQSGNLLV